MKYRSKINVMKLKNRYKFIKISVHNKKEIY